MAAHVVVGADGSSPSQIAVDWAAEDAARRGCDLRIVHVYESARYDDPVQTPPGFHDSVMEYGRDVLEKAISRARNRAPWIEVNASLESGRVVEVLQREAEDAEQVVVGSRGLGGFTGLLLGSISRSLAGHAAAPVVVVKDVPEQVRGEIVVGYDGSEHSMTTLRYAFEEAARRDARVHAIHTWQLPITGGLYTVSYVPMLDDVMAAEERTAKDALSPWREKYPGIEVKQAVICEHPVVALRDASATADLVVVGSRGLGAFESAILGSVSHGILHHAHCPVAVVNARNEA
jgi:nucleotide-binding universal stress UspA family protein